MNLLKQLISRYIHWLLPIAGIVTIILLIIFLHQLNERNEHQEQVINDLKQTIKTNVKTIDTLRQKNSDNQDSLILLRQKSTESQRLIEQQSKQLETLKNENEQLKLWANTPLPNDVIRMYSRSNIIKGSDSYRKQLSESRTMHNPSQ